ncbi:MAG TPA: hypothetical protein VMT85_03435 [Thermoanaerobaculia bacterium]|nr:hypothetical protein [Thermoanaerobaculia bacterium]
MSAVAARIGLDESSPHGARGVLIQPLHDSLVRDSREVLWTLFGAVAIGQLPVCGPSGQP